MALKTIGFIPAPNKWGILSVMVKLAARPSILKAWDRSNQFFLYAIDIGFKQYLKWMITDSLLKSALKMTTKITPTTRIIVGLLQ